MKDEGGQASAFNAYIDVRPELMAADPGPGKLEVRSILEKSIEVVRSAQPRLP